MLDSRNQHSQRHDTQQQEHHQAQTAGSAGHSSSGSHRRTQRARDIHLAETRRAIRHRQANDEFRPGWRDRCSYCRSGPDPKPENTRRRSAMAWGLLASGRLAIARLANKSSTGLSARAFQKTGFWRASSAHRWRKAGRGFRPRRAGVPRMRGTAVGNTAADAAAASAASRVIRVHHAGVRRSGNRRSLHFDRIYCARHQERVTPPRKYRRHTV